MKLLVCILILIVCEFATPQILNSKDAVAYINKFSNSSNTYNSSRLVDKDGDFPIEAIVAGARLCKLLFIRIKNQNFEKLQEKEFRFIADDRSKYPLGSLFAIVPLGNYIGQQLLEEPNHTVEDIMKQKSFPWDSIVEASKQGRIIFDEARKKIPSSRRYIEKLFTKM
ncbi:hypothetical protein AKO1_005211 [Acrasis kona]|uniref:Uncharacterized protein n=1 Tax=Acrasis kona TaxID=1008807 RepID=A0AAW2YLF9_9EUKA